MSISQLLEYLHELIGALSVVVLLHIDTQVAFQWFIEHHVRMATVRSMFSHSCECDQLNATLTLL